MSGGLCVCVLLAVLSASSFGQQTGGSPNGDPLPAELGPSLRAHHRPLRAPASAGPLRPAPRPDGSLDHRANVGALLAKYLQQARKGVPREDRMQISPVIPEEHPFIYCKTPPQKDLSLAARERELCTGPTGRLSVMGNRVQSIDPTHRINDRDYMGWMDFGRRSAEEYEYSS